MAVYMFAAPSLGLCKIGFAVNVQRRFKLVQTTAPATLEIVAERNGDRWTEACLHKEFSEAHVRGEWFRYSDDMPARFLAFVEPDKALREMPRHEPNWDRILPLAERLGVSSWNRFKWRQRGAVPARWHLKLICASNGAIVADDFMRFPTPENGSGK